MILQRNENLWKDIRQQVNEHNIRAADSQQALDLLVSIFERLRDNMMWQFNKLEVNRKADMKRHVPAQSPRIHPRLPDAGDRGLVTGG